MTEDELLEKISEYSDRQVVSTLICKLPKKHLEKLLIGLMEDFG